MSQFNFTRISLALALVVALSLTACGGGDDSPAPAPAAPLQVLKVVVTTFECPYSGQNIIAGQPRVPLVCGHLTATGEATVVSARLTKTGSSDDDAITGVGFAIFSEKGGPDFYANEAVNFRQGGLTLRPEAKLSSGASSLFQVRGDIAHRYSGVPWGTTAGFALGEIKVTFDTSKYARAEVVLSGIGQSSPRTISEPRRALVYQELGGHQFVPGVTGLRFMATRVVNLDPVPFKFDRPLVSLGSSSGFDAGAYMRACVKDVRMVVTRPDGTSQTIWSDTSGWQYVFGQTSVTVDPMDSVLVEIFGNTESCDPGVAGAVVDFYLQGGQEWPTLKRPGDFIWSQEPARMSVPTSKG
jgi:hypothetical protein